MSDGDPPYHVGFSYILPITLKQSLGQIIVPITNTHQRPIGQVSGSFQSKFASHRLIKRLLYYLDLYIITILLF